MTSPGFYEQSIAEIQFCGYIIFMVLGWYAIFKPSWFGLRQMLGRVDPLAEAMAGVRSALSKLFVDIKGLAEASNADYLATAGKQGLADLFGGKGGQVLEDVELLLLRAPTTYRNFQVRWAPKLQTINSDPAPKALMTVHGFWLWLRSAEVASVVAAAGRRMGFGHDPLQERQVQLQKVVKEHAPDLAHGFLYGLYSVLVCQFFLLEMAFAFGRPSLLFWVALSLVLFNVIKLSLFLREAWQFWPLRKEALEIAELAGVPSLPRYAFRLLVGHALGVVTMLLLVIRFLALGEALQRPGNILSGLHQTIHWFIGMYFYLVRIIFTGT